jgi:hypothetical protein
MLTTRLYLLGGAIALLVVVFLWGYAEGRSSAKNKELKTQVEQIQQKRSLENEIATIDDVDLDERLSRWMRD